MDVSGRPISACIGAVANEVKETFAGGGVVGFDVMKSDEGGDIVESVGHDEGIDTIISDSGKDSALVAKGDVTLDFGVSV
jgi:hypothetical protein